MPLEVHCLSDRDHDTPLNSADIDIQIHSTPKWHLSRRGQPKARLSIVPCKRCLRWGCPDNCAASTYRNSRKILVKQNTKRKIATEFSFRHRVIACKSSFCRGKIHLKTQIYVSWTEEEVSSISQSRKKGVTAPYRAQNLEKACCGLLVSHKARGGVLTQWVRVPQCSEDTVFSLIDAHSPVDAHSLIDAHFLGTWENKRVLFSKNARSNKPASSGVEKINAHSLIQAHPVFGWI